MKQNRNPQQEKGIYICGLILLGLLAFWLGAEHFLGLKFSLPPCVFHSLTGLYCPRIVRNLWKQSARRLFKKI